MSERARQIPWVVWIGIAAVNLFSIGRIVVVGARAVPALFVGLALSMLLLALIALYQSLRSAFADASTGIGLRVRLPERAALLDEKDALLRAIKDIAFEHEVGKLSDGDFGRLDRAYRTRAKEVLQKLDDDLAPFLERAERMLKQELGSEGAPHREASPAESKRGKKKKKTQSSRRDCPACGTSNAAEATWCKECGASMSTVACSECGAQNEADAKFCIACAKPVRGTETPSADREVVEPASEGEAGDEGSGERPS